MKKTEYLPTNVNISSGQSAKCRSNKNMLPKFTNNTVITLFAILRVTVILTGQLMVELTWSGEDR